MIHTAFVKYDIIPHRVQKENAPLRGVYSILELDYFWIFSGTGGGLFCIGVLRN